MIRNNITEDVLKKLGFPDKIIPLALKITDLALKDGLNLENISKRLTLVAQKPQKMLDDIIFAELAKTMEKYSFQVNSFQERKILAPWQQWGDINVDNSTISQMENACRLPISVRGALMPDAHIGYGLPIGGVLAVKNAVIPYAVGVDIACRMRLSVLDLPLSYLHQKQDLLINALEKETCFGVGASFTTTDQRKHSVLDEDWSFCKVVQQQYDKAAKQLGSSGAGNHFAEFGELIITDERIGIKEGKYLALLSHSGSRGTGEAIASHYSKLAQKLRPDLPSELKHLAWLDLDSEAGQEYWQAMELMGRYSAANHELIHHYVLNHIGAKILAKVENHHNFAWKEEYDKQELVVHRKGATPAKIGSLGIVPGSMGTPGFVVRGLGNESSLNSCSHGAGRLMSRTEAIKTFSRKDIEDFLKRKKVHLISAGLDEAPMAYKDIHQVMQAQQDLVETLAQFNPRVVKMAAARRNHKRRKNRRQ